VTAPAKRIRTVIVDDEPLGREGVRLLLVKDASFEIVGECANTIEALATVTQHHPELLFLDISMPGNNGFDLLKDIPKALMPLVVFVTAHDQYAVPAFEVHALDYLLKPLNASRFGATLARIKSYVAERRQIEISGRLVSLLDQLQLAADRRASPSGYLERFAVRTGESITFIQVDEVNWIEATDYYATLHCAKKNHLIREPIKELEAKLDPTKFVRIHRSTIVKTEKIREVKRQLDGGYEVVLTDQTRLKLSRSHLPELKALLGKR
jgi:two-component system LytT family response regulator